MLQGSMRLTKARFHSSAASCSLQALTKGFKLPEKSTFTTGQFARSLSSTSWARSSDKMLCSQFLVPQNFINGQLVPPSNGQTYELFNPANKKLIGSVANSTHLDAQQAIDAALQAFPDWSNTTAKVRADLLIKLHALQLKHAEALAQLITLEMGKPIREARGEIQYGASFFEWFAHEARRITGEIIASPWSNKELQYRKEAIGVAGIITPWNFPNAMITRKIGAALAAGCPVVIKPAEDTPYSALALAMLAQEAGFPPGVVNVVASSRENTPAIGDLFCTSHDVAVISFTGSTAVGRHLMEKSSVTVKRICMELGGDAPFIVFDSADIGAAVEGCLVSKFRNSGQVKNKF